MDTQYDAGIILGHFYSRLGFSSRQKKRMDKGVRLLNRGVVRVLITTGGRGLFNLTSKPLGRLAKEYLVKNGVDESEILVEDESVNTYQNAEFALKMMEQNNLKSAIVITSAVHTRRAKRIFGDVFPKDFQIDFVISDHVSGIWTVWDYLWAMAGWIKYGIKKLALKN